MNYGLVSEKDNETTFTFMKSKKVSSSNIVAVSKLNVLVSIITSGDVIYVAFADMVLKTGRVALSGTAGYLCLKFTKLVAL